MSHEQNICACLHCLSAARNYEDRKMNPRRSQNGPKYCQEGVLGGRSRLHGCLLGASWGVFGGLQEKVSGTRPRGSGSGASSYLLSVFVFAPMDMKGGAFDFCHLLKFLNPPERRQVCIFFKYMHMYCLSAGRLRGPII